MATQTGSLLATRRGRLTLLPLRTVQSLDIADSSIMNVALPSIRHDPGFSVQGLHWNGPTMPTHTPRDTATMTAATTRRLELPPA